MESRSQRVDKGLKIITCNKYCKCKTRRQDMNIYLENIRQIKIPRVYLFY